MRKRRKVWRVCDFLRFGSTLTADTLKRIQEAKRPANINGKETPVSLMHITYGQLTELSEQVKTDEQFLTKPLEVLMEFTHEDALHVPLHEAAGLSNWTYEQLAKIGELWQKCRVEPTPEEKAAGCDKMNFGTFGLIDWYARRMGITDHDEVLKVTWTRIYKCMQMEVEQTRFQRRLQKVYENKSKLKKKK